MTGVYSLNQDEYEAKATLIILSNELGHSLDSEQNVNGYFPLALQSRERALR